MSTPHCITLIGMMGSGKTLVGRYLALRLGWTFIDLDEQIVKDAGRSISDIFATDGEPAFRALELKTLEEIITPLRSPSLSRDPLNFPAAADASNPVPEPVEWPATTSTILSLGGGTILQPACARLVKEHSLCVRLTASVSTLCDRLKADRKRPLLRGTEPLEDKIKRLLTERDPAYTAAADISIPTDSRSVDEIIDDILSRLW